MVRTKQGTQGQEWTWHTGVSQNEADHIVRTKKATHGYESTWCAGVSRNGAGHTVRTQHLPTAKHKILFCERSECLQPLKEYSYVILYNMYVIQLQHFTLIMLYVKCAVAVKYVVHYAIIYGSLVARLVCSREQVLNL